MQALSKIKVNFTNKSIIDVCELYDLMWLIDISSLLYDIFNTDKSKEERNLAKNIFKDSVKFIICNNNKFEHCTNVKEVGDVLSQNVELFDTLDSKLLNTTLECIAIIIKMVNDNKSADINIITIFDVLKNKLSKITNPEFIDNLNNVIGDLWILITHYYLISEVTFENTNLAHYSGKHNSHSYSISFHNKKVKQINIKVEKNKDMPDVDIEYNSEKNTISITELDIDNFVKEILSNSFNENEDIETSVTENNTDKEVSFEELLENK